MQLKIWRYEKLYFQKKNNFSSNFCTTPKKICHALIVTDLSCNYYAIFGISPSSWIEAIAESLPRHPSQSSQSPPSDRHIINSSIPIWQKSRECFKYTLHRSSYLMSNWKPMLLVLCYQAVAFVPAESRAENGTEHWKRFWLSADRWKLLQGVIFLEGYYLRIDAVHVMSILTWD